MIEVETVSWCESCEWRDTSLIDSRADRHTREKSHVTHTTTKPKEQA